MKDLFRTPSVIRAEFDRIRRSLKAHGLDHRAPGFKRLDGELKGLWRFRTQSYRFVIAPREHEPKFVLVGVGPRAVIYDKVKRIFRKGTGDLQPVVGEEPVLHLTAAEPPGLRSVKEVALRPDRDGPKLSRATAEALGVPSRLIADAVALEGHGSVSQFCDREDVPPEVAAAVMAHWYPPADDSGNASEAGAPLPALPAPVKREREADVPVTVAVPVRLVPEELDIDRAIAEKLEFEDLPLALDPDQKKFVARFERRGERGPWLVRGGPGSGKTVVSLYALKALLQPRQRRLDVDEKNRRVAYVTFTRSLRSDARLLLERLGVSGVELWTIQELAQHFLGSEISEGQVLAAEDRKFREIVGQCAGRLRRSERASSTFEDEDVGFLCEEIDRVLLGWGCNSEEHYVQSAERSGRGRRLSSGQRRSVWKIWEMAKEELEKRSEILWSQRILLAVARAKPTFDYVFIDEAQDLSPAALDLCLKTCKDRKRLLVTEDPNQSIYGRAVAWSSVGEGLGFSGRSTRLRSMYRTTREMWLAFRDFAAQLPKVDKETLDCEPAYSGPRPRVGYYSDLQEQASKIAEFVSDACRSGGHDLGAAAVLVPELKRAALIAAALPKSLNAKAMNSRTADHTWKGVKVLTLHSAKGLEFPVVVVTGVEKGMLPRNPADDASVEEHMGVERRKLYVAMTRASRRLLVLGHRSPALRSPLLESFREPGWEADE